MAKKYKLLLHIGFAKTASTSLQDNVLYPLHKEGKINYLGKTVCKNNIESLWTFRILKEAFKKGNLTQQTIEQLRIKVEQQSSTDKLNVLSDENFSQLLQHYSAQMAYIFGNYDVHILCSLRSPVDRVYSNFIESYGRKRHISHKNTLEKYSQDLFNNRHSKHYSRFFVEDYLPLIDQHFSHKTILLFEDLTQDEDHYYQTLSNLLKVDKNEIKDKFLVKKQNSKTTHSAGKMSIPKPAKMLDRLYYFIHKNRLFQYCSQYKDTSLKYPWMLLSNTRKMLIYLSLWKKKAVMHPYPDKNLDSKIFALLKIKDTDTFAMQHNLDKNKLIKYRY